MSVTSHWAREGWFLARDKTALGALIVLLALSVISAAVGIAKVSNQRASIEAMIAADAANREAAQNGLTTYGDAAYYSFYITYDSPSPLAFAAIGQRDTAPYMKRIRLLAIEGQIYQGESPNPLLAQIGSLDLAFIAAYVLPLTLIILLYDLKSGERAAGREMMLAAMPAGTKGLWLPRIFWRTSAAFACIALPFCVGAAIEGAAPLAAASAIGAISAVCLFWALVVSIIASSPWRGATIAACLIGLWLMLNIMIPLGTQLLLVSQVSGPAGSDVALIQREAVNDAWDQPKEDILQPFAALYPYYAVKEDLAPFDWRWYFAFQTMGDAAAKEVSEAYRSAIRSRDGIAGAAAWFSPALALQRRLTRLAETDVKAQLAYDRAIREYHDALRAFYFPLVFAKNPYNQDALQQYPRFID